MILSKDVLNITIDGTIFRSSPFQNPQFVLDEKALEGFLDGVSVKRSDTVRPNQWGDFSEPSLLNSRHMSLTGTAIANTTAQLMQMRDEFTGLFRGGAYREIAIQNSVDTRYTTIAIEGQPSFIQKLDTVAIWKLDIYAPDPRLYGLHRNVQITDSTITGGIDYPLDYPMNYGGETKIQAIAIENNGNTEAWPIFTVTGNFMEGFSITDDNGKFLTYEGVVTMQSPVTIDSAAGTATQNGTDITSSLSRRDWFSIPPKGSIRPLFLPTLDGVGWCDIMYRDTWI